MANRVIVGKSTNSNLGHSGGKYGLYISRTGDDVTNCTKDQLIFNTDNVGSVSGAIDLGQFQIVPTSGGAAAQSIAVNASATASVPTANLGAGHLMLTNNSTSYSGSSQGDSSATVSRFLNGAYTGATSGTLGNTGNTSATVSVAVIKGFLSSSLF